MNKSRTNEIIKYLFQISIGKCQITEQSILAEPDPAMQTILTGLLTLHEDIQYKTSKLEKANEEKTVLLKEIHHRVKNNLQIITSLLSLQASFLDDKKATGILMYSQYRINSMSMIHQLLYESENLSTINYREYLVQLIDGLLFTMVGKNHNVKIDLDIPDMYVNLDTAIPLGLLLNEIITNAIKYGIKNNENPVLSLHLIQKNPPKYTFYIGDNGPGFDDNINFRDSNTLGLKLIHRLASQLNGNIEKDNSKKGTYYILSFEEKINTSFV